MVIEAWIITKTGDINTTGDIMSIFSWKKTSVSLIKSPSVHVTSKKRLNYDAIILRSRFVLGTIYEARL